MTFSRILTGLLQGRGAAGGWTSGPRAAEQGERVHGCVCPCMYVHAYLCARARVQVGARGRARVSSCVPLHVVCLTSERVRQCCSAAAAEVMGSPPWQADSSGRPRWRAAGSWLHFPAPGFVCASMPLRPRQFPCLESLHSLAGTFYNVTCPPLPKLPLQGSGVSQVATRHRRLHQPHGGHVPSFCVLPVGGHTRTGRASRLRGCQLSQAPRSHSLGILHFWRKPPSKIPSGLGELVAGAHTHPPGSRTAF